LGQIAKFGQKAQRRTKTHKVPRFGEGKLNTTGGNSQEKVGLINGGGPKSWRAGVHRKHGGGFLHVKEEQGDRKQQRKGKTSSGRTLKKKDTPLMGGHGEPKKIERDVGEEFGGALRGLG